MKKHLIFISTLSLLVMMPNLFAEDTTTVGNTKYTCQNECVATAIDG